MQFLVSRLASPTIVDFDEGDRSDALSVSVNDGAPLQGGALSCINVPRRHTSDSAVALQSAVATSGISVLPRRQDYQQQTDALLSANAISRVSALSQPSDWTGKQCMDALLSTLSANADSSLSDGESVNELLDGCHGDVVSAADTGDMSPTNAHHQPVTLISLSSSASSHVDEGYHSNVTPPSAASNDIASRLA